MVHKAVFAVIIAGCCAAPVAAERHVVPSPLEQSLYLTGGYAGFRNPADGSWYESVVDILGELFVEFQVPVIFDTGASGALMSNSAQSAFGIPLTGETFDDIGIGGIETFNVTQPVELMLAYHDDILETTPEKAEFVSFGPVSMQARQSDPILTGAVDVIGMPALIDHVMEVQPNSIGEFTLIPFIVYAKTRITNAMPELLPTTRMVVPLEQFDFIDDPNPPVTVSTNPMVPDVRIKFNAGDAGVTSDWLFDSGASVSIFGRDLAAAAGIDLVNDVPVTSVEVIGVGEVIRTLFGYELAELVLPMSNGDEMVYEDVVVFVPEDGALPADLPGILGNNLFHPSSSGTDIFGGIEQPSAFARYFVDLINDEVVFLPRATGDANDDGYVDAADLAIVQANMGLDVEGWAQGDFDGDLVVTQNDLDLLNANFGFGVAVPGDANRDGEVGLLDLDALGVNFGQAGNWLAGDFDGNGVVGLLDLDALGVNYGHGAASAVPSVPEPGAIGLVLMGVGVLGVTRRSRVAK